MRPQLLAVSLWLLAYPSLSHSTVIQPPVSTQTIKARSIPSPAFPPLF